MRTCLHTVSYSGVWGQARLPLEDVIDKAADLGFEGIMLMAKRPHGSVLDLTPARRSEIKARLDGQGIVCGCIAGYTNFTADAGHGDIPMSEMQIDHVTRLGEIAADLGCGIVRVFTGFETPELPFTAAWDRCAEALRESAERVAEMGVTLAVQNHHDLGAAFEAMCEFIGAVDHPNCRAAFDAWTPALQGDDVVEAARLMAPVTAHTTAADYVTLRRFRYEPPVVNFVPQTPYAQAVPMGDGIIDYAGFLGALREGGYDGFVGYEMCSPLRGGGSIENLDHYAARFIEFMRQAPL